MTITNKKAFVEKPFYTVEEARAFGATLQPIKCQFCGHIGEVDYNQCSRTYYCCICGKVQKG